MNIHIHMGQTMGVIPKTIYKMYKSPIRTARRNLVDIADCAETDIGFSPFHFSYDKDVLMESILSHCYPFNTVGTARWRLPRSYNPHIKNKIKK